MAIIGGQINPALYPQPDYSGVIQSARGQSQAMADIGASIGGVIKDFGEIKKQQKKVDALNKASAKAIEAAITLGNSYNIDGVKETLSPFLELYNDPSLSPIEKAALLEEGKGMIPNVFGRFDARQADAIRMAQLNARNAPSPRSVNLQQGTITEIIDGKQYEVPTIFDPSTGETRRLDGSVVGSAFRSPDVIDAGLNLPMGEQTAMPGDGTFPSYGSAEEAMVLPPLPASKEEGDAVIAELSGAKSDVSNSLPIAIESAANMTAPNVGNVPVNPVGGQSLVRIPPGAVPIEEEPKITSKIVSGEEAKKFGGLPDRRYEIKLEGDRIVETKEIPPDLTPTEERAKKKDELEAEQAKKTAESTVKSINKFIDKKGQSNEYLNKAVGYGEELATGVAKYAPILGTQSPMDRANQKELKILVEKGILEAASLLKPVSNVDLMLLKENRPQITDPPELWADWLKNVRNILDDPNSYLETGGESTSQKPETATDRLRAKIK